MSLPLTVTAATTDRFRVGRESITETLVLPGTTVHISAVVILFGLLL
jgi:hypothetical protein